MSLAEQEDLFAMAHREPLPGDHPAADQPDDENTVRVLSSDQTGVVLEISTPEYQLLPGKDAAGACWELLSNGYESAGEAGAPALPIKGAMIGIPQDADIQITVLDADVIDVPGSYVLCPVETPIVSIDIQNPLPDFVASERLRNVHYYNVDRFSPEMYVSVESKGFIRSQRVAEIKIAPFAYNPASGKLRYLRRIQVKISFMPLILRHDNETLAKSYVDEGIFEEVLRQALLNYAEAQMWREPSQATAARSFAVQDSSPAYRLSVTTPGLYRITRADLQVADPAVDLSLVDPRTIHISKQGQEIAVFIEGEEDGSFDADDAIYFYGEEINTKYIRTNVYWLKWDQFAGLRMATLDGTPSGAPVSPYYHRIRRFEVDSEYQSSYPDSYGDHWYWNYVYYPSVPSRTYTLAVPDVASVPLTATLSGLFKGYSATPYHSIAVSVTNHLVYSATWPSGAVQEFSQQFPQTYLTSGNNNLEVRGGKAWTAPVSSDVFYTNWFVLDYYARYLAQNNMAFFAGDGVGTWQYQVPGFTSDTIWTFDISDPTHPIRILNAAVTPVDGLYRLDFQQTLTAVTHDYFALTPARFSTSLSITRDAPSNLRSTDNGADYVIIAHPDFYNAMQPLVDYHTQQGMRVTLVDVQDIYDEFAYGLFDPEAIRSFLAYAYANWQTPAPLYILLVGDGNYDPKNNLGLGEPNYIPPYLLDIDPWVGETAADNRYVSIHGDDIWPDMYLGRFPVQTAAQATVMVNKVLAYEQMPESGDWNRKILFVADNTDSGGDFGAFSDVIANTYVPTPYVNDKVYWGVTHTNLTSARSAIQQAMNAGRLIVNYVGHGSTRGWASENLWQRDYVATMSNGGRLPFMVPMTCAEGYYIFPPLSGTNMASLGETVTRVEGKGAIASWSPTGYGLATGHDIMNRALFAAIFFEDVTALGPATTLGKLALAGMGHDYLIETYLLFGDPALRLNVLPADVALSQTITPTTPLYPGDWLTYTLTFTNTGPARANNVVIEDPLPAMLLTPTVTSSGATITPRPDTRFVWDVADLVPGAGGRITITARVALDYAGTFTHTATIRTTARETATLNNSASLTTQVIAADVEILKTGPHSALPGQTIEYVLSYGNVGTAPAAGVVITDLLRAELLNPVVTSSGPAITPRPGQTFVWDVAPLSPGARGCITITAQVSSTFLGGVLSNQSTISTSSPEVQKANNVSAIVATGVLVPDLIVEQGGPAVALPGMGVTYVVTYVNLGNEIASGVVMTDLLPSALQNVTVFSEGAVITPRVGSAYVWDVADLPPATGGRITLTGTIAPEFRGTLVNTATIAAKTPDSHPDDNTAVLSTFVSIADVTIAKTGPTAVLAGERLTYTLAFTNTDNALATGVVITDTLPPELLGVNVTSSLPGVTARPGTSFVWDVPDLAPGAGGTLTIGGRISSLYRGALFNQAWIAAASPEATTANNTSARVETFVSRPDVTIAKIGPAQVSPGDVMTYTLVYTNADNALATGVVITDVLPATLMTPTVTHVGAEITPRSGTSFVWDVADLAPGAGGVITLTARVRADASAALVNTAWIAAASELNTANNGSAPVVTQLLLPDVLIQKRGPATAASGDVITYRLTFTNAGTSLARGVVITDVLPASLHGASFAASGAAVTPRPGQTFVWDVTDLAPGAGGVLTLTATVDAAYAGTLTNTASIATSNFERDADHNSDQLVTQITRSYRVYLPLVIRQSP